MTLTTIILLVLVLYLVQLFLQETSRFGFDLWGIVGNRDNLPEISVIAGRQKQHAGVVANIPLPGAARAGQGRRHERGSPSGIDLPYRARRLCAGLCEWCPHAKVARVVGSRCQPPDYGAAPDLAQRNR